MRVIRNWVCELSNQWNQFGLDDDDDEETPQQQTPKGLRSHVSKLEKDNAELRAQNDKLLKQVRESAISQVLSTKGYSPKVAKLIPSDVEPTAEAVEKFLADYADVFPAKPPAQEGGQTPPAQNAEAGQEGDEGEEDDGSGEYAAQMGRMSTVANGAQVPGKASDLIAQLTNKSLTHEQLMGMIEAAGGGYGAG